MNDDSLLIQIGNVYVSEEVMDVFFSCDLSKCMGACCATENASVGAPLTDTERELITINKDKLAQYIPTENRISLEKTGPIERHDVRFFTATMPNNAQCVLAKQDKGCWTCAIQKHKNELGFDKPISCSLFPIREMMTDDFKPLLVMEYWDECDPAFDKGEQDDVLVYQALKEGLIQRFGQGFYTALDEFVKSGKLQELMDA